MVKEDYTEIEPYNEPCPFCGCKELIFVPHRNSVDYTVSLKGHKADCFFRTFFKFMDYFTLCLTRKDVDTFIKYWNIRSQDND